jgi:hypothetical protein
MVLIDRVSSNDAEDESKVPASPLALGDSEVDPDHGNIEEAPNMGMSNDGEVEPKVAASLLTVGDTGMDLDDESVGDAQGTGKTRGSGAPMLRRGSTPELTWIGTFRWRLLPMPEKGTSRRRFH